MAVGLLTLNCGFDADIVYMLKPQWLLLPLALRFFSFCLWECLLLASWLFDGIVKPALVNRYQKRAAKLIQEFTAGANEV